jgi:hypothetical protein
MNRRHEWNQEIGHEIGRGIARKIGLGIAFLIAFLLFIALGGVVVQWLWNWLLPDILGLRRITIWEALGLLALSRILFGGFGRGGGSRMRSGRRRRRGRDRTWWHPPAPPDTGSPVGERSGPGMI